MTNAKSRKSISCRRRVASRKAGFTIIEVILALTILSLIVLTSYTLLTSVTEAKVILDRNRDATFIGNSLLTRLSREFQLADSGRPLLKSCSDSSAAAPPTGSQINFIGERQPLGMEGRGDTVTFLAREGGQYVPDGGTHTGVVQITYHVEKDPDAEKENRQETFLLIRDEMPYRKPDAKACEDMIRFPVARDVLSFELSYYDKKSESWQDSWGKDRFVKVPQMVQFRLKLRGSDGAIRTYSSAVAIRTVG